LFQFLALVLLMIAIVAFGQRYFSARAGWWSAAILLSNPLVLWAGSVSYVEIALMLFVTMTLYAFWNWWQSKAQHWLVLAGVFCGLAIGTKYNVLLFLITFQLAASFFGSKRRRYLGPMAFGLVALATASPWFVRNFYYMHNPVFPYFYKQFV